MFNNNSWHHCLKKIVTLGDETTVHTIFPWPWKHMVSCVNGESRCASPSAVKECRIFAGA